ncbi:uncharacterized protein FOMMEDRAFT_138046 [Fomitiporia mediterranea MF3/22]|uniref:uncharacterized protein n=1 Tax=Fomitiporia mediterranea (strain MF3/22) TaxID=694068 RepID=UPI0004409227|nr:uncharacterized protein FOMMEDRAFT_138046 [Fomitiporia mediterranea MF3/22]EJD07965.1 hypothetical protein FOMMEDRAFT_138046 [Fomitiporia mediterranea MF3/22]
MKPRATAFSLFALVIAASAAPNPSPVDKGVAQVVAVNDNLGCSSGTCNTTLAETNDTSSNPPAYSSAAWTHREAWSPFTFLAVGGLALSTGML